MRKNTPTAPAIVYLASPLGFYAGGDEYRKRIKRQLASLGLAVIDPWEEQDEVAERLAAAAQIDSHAERVKVFGAIARDLGGFNEAAIRASDHVLAILDFDAIDCGTASELGFAAALGKTCYGLRTDFRDVGDMPGVPINLQVLHFIEKSGGELFRKIEDVRIPGGTSLSQRLMAMAGNI